MKVIILAITAVAIATLTGCIRNSCALFEERVHVAGVAAQLESWVDQRAAAGQLQPHAKDRGRVRNPGEYAIPLDFDPVAIGLGSKAEARPILGADRQVAAVFFGERNFQGIVVRLNAEPLPALPDSILIRVTPRTSTVCQKRD